MRVEAVILLARTNTSLVFEVFWNRCCVSINNDIKRLSYTERIEHTDSKSES